RSASPQPPDNEQSRPLLPDGAGRLRRKEAYVMPTLTERYEGVTDRTGWPSGPWDGEPDKAVWVDETTGLDCMIVRGPVGALCGYVGVKEGHPWHGRSYGGCMAGHEDCWVHSPDSLIEVH